MIKICVVTAARSDYSPLKWIMKELVNSKKIQMQLIVTGAHLMEEQGYTADEIVNDGFVIDKEVPYEIDSDDKTKMAKSLGDMAGKLAEAYRELSPQYILVLGDRYELLPICSTAFIMGIPIIHVSGGDVTEGANDNEIRNAVTMLSSIHFPGTVASYRNIVRMTGRADNVYTVGEPGLDCYNMEALIDRKSLSEMLTIDIDKKWVLMTYHAETKETTEYNLNCLSNIIEGVLSQSEYRLIITYGNTDFGGGMLNKKVEEYGEQYKDRIRVVKSLGSKNYLSLMKEVCFIIGNSSSGIIEAPFLNKPVINVGQRQKGRHLCSNVIQCEGSREEIINAIEKSKQLTPGNDLYYYGDGHTAERILKVLETEIV